VIEDSHLEGALGLIIQNYSLSTVQDVLSKVETDLSLKLPVEARSQGSTEVIALFSLINKGKVPSRE
jgi:hypothetical protein